MTDYSDTRPPTPTRIRAWEAAHREAIDSWLLDTANGLRAAIHAEAEALTDDPAFRPLVRVMLAAALIDATYDLRSWEGGVAQSFDYSGGQIATAAGQARDSRISRWPGLPEVSAASAAAWENRNDPAYRPEPVAGRRLSITVDTYRPDDAGEPRNAK